MDVPYVIPAVELRGSTADRLQTLDAAISRLQGLRRTLAGDAVPTVPSYGIHGPHVNAPAWPWFIAGWFFGVLVVLLFLVAWSYS